MSGEYADFEEAAAIGPDLGFYGCGTVMMATAFIGIIFLPLALSFAEHMLLGTNHVEDFFRRIHLHQPLGELYNPLVGWLRELFS